MTLYGRRLRYPDGESQEIEHRLAINQLVDLNGTPLRLPLSTVKMIVYRVWRITTDVARGEEWTNYDLELMRVDELREMHGL